MTREDRRDGLLLDTLQTAVHLEMQAARQLSPGEQALIAGRLAGEMDKLDELLYGGPDCGAGFAALARALAVLALQPGGVRFRSLGFCAAHPRERWPDAGIACPGCLREAGIGEDAA